MKINLSIVAIIYLLLAIFDSTHAYGGGEPSGNIEIFKCEVKSVSISNINVSPTQALFDEKGKPSYFVRRGSSDLIIASEKINLENGDSKKIAELMGKRVSWKAKPRKPTDGVIVGLAEDSVDALIFLENKWWLLRIYSNNIGMIEVELIFEKKSVKVATMKMGEKPIISDDQEIINAFSRLIGK